MKVTNMKIVKFLLCLICVLPMIGCSEGEFDETETGKGELNEIETAEYYVKYCFGGQTYNRKYDFSVKFTTILNNLITQHVASYEGWASRISDELVCGPFKLGDTVSLKMSYSSMTNTYLEIHVSKNNSPFALKESGSGYIEYEIDY